VIPVMMGHQNQVVQEEGDVRAEIA
jgi:hypothetical protein